MTETRKGMFLHLGGPYDGAEMPVEVDAGGVPVETNTVNDITFPAGLRNPAMTMQADRIVALYERDEVLADTGFAYVFRYVVQELPDRRAA